GAGSAPHRPPQFGCFSPAGQAEEGMGKDKDNKKNGKKAKHAGESQSEDQVVSVIPDNGSALPCGKKAKEHYARRMVELQTELAHLQAWVKQAGARIVVIFEGRDAAGKGGIIKRLTERVSP